MKKITFVFATAASIMLYSCIKDPGPSECVYKQSSVVAPLSEQQTLQDSLTAHNIQAMKDTAGFFYAVNQPGSGNGIKGLCSSVMVNYTGSLFNGKIFDSSVAGKPAIFQLGQVIPGWQKGVPHSDKGGDIMLYIPPSLAYGPKPLVNSLTGDTVLPANSYLVFHVQILDVSN